MSRRRTLSSGEKVSKDESSSSSSRFTRLLARESHKVFKKFGKLPFSIVVVIKLFTRPILRFRVARFKRGKLNNIRTGRPTFNESTGTNGGRPMELTRFRREISRSCLIFARYGLKSSLFVYV